MIDSNTLYGTLNLLILKTLESESLHGLDIQRRILATTGDALKVEEGALYPALHRLQRDGLLRSEWGRSDRGRRAKFYSLTAKGRRRLEREMSRWLAHIEAVARVLEVADASTLAAAMSAAAAERDR